MVIKIKNNLMDELQDYGAFDVSACYNCGTCTASCPFVEEDSGNEFPRGMIRLAQLGQKEKLIGSRELWMCYFCGDCTAACPRDANPAQFMQATRRYAIAEFGPSSFSKLLHKNRIFLISVMVALGFLFALFMEYTNDIRLFEHDYILLGGYYGEIIHFAGISMGIFLGIIIVYGIVNMYKTISRHEPLRQREYMMDHLKTGPRIKLALKSLWNILYREGVKQERFLREDPAQGAFFTEGEPPKTLKINNPLAPDQRTTRWVIHMSIVWGFIGLAGATAYNYLIKDLVQGNPGGFVEIYHPVRVIGIISGISMMFGTSVAIYYRMRKPEDNEYYKDTQFDDWLLLILIWLIGFTGFMTTLAVYLDPLPSWSGLILIIHVVVVGELFFLLPFTKFAHLFYRPMALWMWKYEDAKIEYLDSLTEEERTEVIKVIAQ